MKAATHTEVYRPFRGTIAQRGLRFWPLTAAGIRTATKRRLPLLLFYAPPAIATVIFSFLVYGTYAAETQLPAAGGGMRELAVNAFAKQAMKQLEVKRLVVLFHQIMVWFVLLSTAWYGSGQFADDRRVGAHQLYFSRPLTRLDYALGKFSVVAFFASCGLLLPGLVLCLVATLTSPDASFLFEQYDVILETLVYGGVWVFTISLAVLATSSLASRKVFALVGMFAIFVLSFALASLLGHEVDPRFFAISPIMDIWALGGRLFEVPSSVPVPEWTLGLKVLGGYVLLFAAVIAWRLRKLEVVA